MLAGRTGSNPEDNDETRQARNKELALHHALIIQRQKDAEAAALRSIEELIEFPLRTRDPRLPDPLEVQQLKSHLKLFKASDFDDAVQERNVEDKCGYFLCAKQRRTNSGKGKFRLTSSQGVVPREKVEQWCSDDCRRRAMYLWIQLKDTPVGERISKDDGGLKLYGEVEGRQTDEYRAVTDLAQSLDHLAMERGDQANSFRAKSVAVGIREKNLERDEAPQLPSQSLGQIQQIEGFTPSAPGTWNMALPMRPAKINDNDDILDKI